LSQKENRKRKRKRWRKESAENVESARVAIVNLTHIFAGGRRDKLMNGFIKTHPIYTHNVE